MKVRLIATLLAMLTIVYSRGEEPRVWTTAGGRTAVGVMVSKSEKTIKLRLPNGGEAKIEIATLSIGDQQYIKTWTPTEPKRPIYVPEDASYFDGSWYKAILEKDSWSGAKEKAEKMEGHLAWIKDQETQDFLAKLADGLKLWLGATDTEIEGLWRWTDGEKLEYANWLKGHPNNYKRRQHYLMMGVNDGKWNDLGLHDGDIVGYIVQWDQ